MHKQKGFTLIELLVVIAIIALLMSILVPALAKARKQAKNAICMANLKHWASMFAMFAGDHDGYFMQGFRGPENTGSWFSALRPYYGEAVGKNATEVRAKEKCCPEAAVLKNDSLSGSTFEPWGSTNGSWIHSRAGDYGSYGTNTWSCNFPRDDTETVYRYEYYWRRDDVKHAGEIPMFLDATIVCSAPFLRDSPPEYPGEEFFFLPRSYGTKVFCIPRHAGERINGAFVDYTVRSIGLKELWLLRWHRLYSIGEARKSEPVWPEWMERFRDYDYYRE